MFSPEATAARALVTLALGAVLLLGCAPRDHTASVPDIVLISIDSLRSDHLGAYGYGPPTSPTLDRLAAEGALFETAVSTTSWTLPAHTALFTGLFDSAHGVTNDGHRLADSYSTLAERLGARGYTTAGFYGGPYLHRSYGLDQGFDHYESCMSAMAEGSERHDESHHDITGPRTLERVTAWLASRPPDATEPLFLFIHLWDVHYDYNAPDDLVALFDPDYSGEITGQSFPSDPAVHRDMPERDLRHLLALYDAEIRFTDDIVRRLLETISRSRDGRDRLVVVTADHGEEFLDHGGKGHRQTLYEEVVRVPMIMHWPERIEPGRRIPRLVSLVDVLPTLVAAAGTEAAAGPLQGRDLGPVLGGDEIEPSPVLLELLIGDTWLRGLRTESTKLLRRGERRFQVFDLLKDPGELRPQPAEGDDMRRLLRRLIGVTKASAALAEGRRGSDAQIPEEVRRRLESLGYLSGD